MGQIVAIPTATILGWTTDFWHQVPTSMISAFSGDQISQLTNVQWDILSVNQISSMTAQQLQQIPVETIENWSSATRSKMEAVTSSLTPAQQDALNNGVVILAVSPAPTSSSVPSTPVPTVASAAP